MEKEPKNITDYEDPATYSSKKTIKTYKVALWIVSVVGVALLVTFGLRAYQVSTTDPFEKPGSTLPQEYFLSSAKVYFDYDPTKLPTAVGTCTTASLKTIQENQLMSDIEYYQRCDKNITMVKVCKLESGNYHFEVNMSCGGDVISYSDPKELTNESVIAQQNDAKVSFTYQAQRLNTENATFGEREVYWEDEIPYENYKIVKSNTYYRYRDKEWRYQGDVRYYYPQDKSNTELVEEYYKTSPDPAYPFKEVSQNYAYKWYIQNGDGPRHYYPSGSTDVNEENTYYLTSPVKGAIRDTSTKTLAAKYYRVETTDSSDYFPSAPSPTAKKLLETETRSAWSDYSLQIPEPNLFGEGNREIETRNRVEIIPITTTDDTNVEWEQVTQSYMNEDEFLSELQKLGYNVRSIEEVAQLPDIKYEVKQSYQLPNKA